MTLYETLLSGAAVKVRTKVCKWFPVAVYFTARLRQEPDFKFWYVEITPKGGKTPRRKPTLPLAEVKHWCEDLEFDTEEE